MANPSAFDALAPSYDRAFTGTPIARYLRRRVRQRLSIHCQPGDDVLELGCGTGEDALWLARRGVRVLATDASDAMLEVARAKTAHEPLVTIARLDVNTLPLSPRTAVSTRGVWERGLGGEGFSLAFSNFGALNCLSEWRTLAAWLAERIQPGGMAAFGVMSPYCLWEMAWHGFHGNFKTAFRRLRGNTTFQLAPDAAPIPIRYPTIRRLERDFAPHFRRVHVEPLGVFLPPTDAYGVVEKRPRLMRTLTSLEHRLGKWRGLAPFADHYWVEFERVSP